MEITMCEAMAGGSDRSYDAMRYAVEDVADVFDLAGAGIALLDGAGQVHASNRAAERILSDPPSFLVARRPLPGNAEDAAERLLDLGGLLYTALADRTDPIDGPDPAACRAWVLPVAGRSRPEADAVALVFFLTAQTDPRTGSVVRSIAWPS